MDEQRDQPQEARPAPETPAGGAVVATGGRALLVYATQARLDARGRRRRGRGAARRVRRGRRARGGRAPSPAGYDAVVVGGPMIMGWHKDAREVPQAAREQLARVPFALFVTAASLTEDGVDDVQGMPVAKDPWLVKKPRQRGQAAPQGALRPAAHYLGDILKDCAPARPRSVAFFAGSLDLTTMNIFEKLFVLLVVGATPGDGRHWEFVREWAAGLGGALAG